MKPLPYTKPLPPLQPKPKILPSGLPVTYGAPLGDGDVTCSAHPSLQFTGLHPVEVVTQPQPSPRMLYSPSVVPPRKPPKPKPEILNVHGQPVSSQTTPELILPSPSALAPIPQIPRTEESRGYDSDGDVHGEGVYTENPSTQSSDSSGSPALFFSSHAKPPKRWNSVYRDKAQFYIAKLTPTCFLPAQTIRWCRNASDELASQ